MQTQTHLTPGPLTSAWERGPAVPRPSVGSVLHLGPSSRNQKLPSLGQEPRRKPQSLPAPRTPLTV